METDTGSVSESWARGSVLDMCFAKAKEGFLVMMRGFSKGFRRPYKSALLTTNHFENTFTTAVGTEDQNDIANTVAAPTNRGSDIPAGCNLMMVHVKALADAIVVGKHQCLMFKRPAATAFATPIASYLSQTSPLTEEAIQIRRDAMGVVDTKFTVSGANQPTIFNCIWKSRKGLNMRVGDDIVISFLDALTTVYDCQIFLRYVV